MNILINNILSTVTAKFVEESADVNFIEENEKNVDNLNHLNVNINDGEVFNLNDSDFHFLTDSFELLT